MRDGLLLLSLIMPYKVVFGAALEFVQVMPRMTFRLGASATNSKTK